MLENGKIEMFKCNALTKIWKVTIHNLVNTYRIKRYAEKYNIHEGQKQILIGGVWIDKDNKIYNCMGNHIGEIKFNEGFGVRH